MNETPANEHRTSWRRSGTYGGRIRKESIAKRDHGGVGEVTVRTVPVSISSRAFGVVDCVFELGTLRKHGGIIREQASTDGYKENYLEDLKLEEDLSRFKNITDAGTLISVSATFLSNQEAPSPHRRQHPRTLKLFMADEYRKEYIRDAFIRGLKCPRIRQRLLENTSMTLDQAFEQARTLESAEVHAASYMGSTIRSYENRIFFRRNRSNISGFLLLLLLKVSKMLLLWK
ncbi:hypothetical protein TNCV_1412131 [Trichonephila clavipes]|nr:hypothetical protein TNCV_1412131 [Trichonephila clavipes]